MASEQQCREALDILAGRLSGTDPSAKIRTSPDRTLACTILDLDVTFHGRLVAGDLVDITTEPMPPAQIRLVLSSADLLALTAGELNFAHAWATGRLHLNASLRDLFRLRSLL